MGVGILMAEGGGLEKRSERGGKESTGVGRREEKGAATLTLHLGKGILYSLASRSPPIALLLSDFLHRAHTDCDLFDSKAQAQLSHC